MGSQAQAADTTPRIAIIGAGLTGLLVAHGLKKNGFPDTVIYERHPAIDSRPRDWTIVLHWAMPTFLDLLPEDIRDNISKGYCNPYLDYSDESTESITCYDGRTGNELFTNKMPGSRRVSRQKLRGVLAEGLDIRWGKELIGINSDDDGSSGPVKLVFADGDVIEADYVMGADGPGSKVRRLLFPGREEDSKLVNSGFMIATCVVKYEDREKVEKIVEAHPVAAITMSADTVMGFGVMNADNPQDKSTWSTFWVKIWRGTVAALPVPRHGHEALEYIKQNTTGLAERFQSFIDWTPAGSPCDIDEMKYWVPVPFNNRRGRVTLAGDAAHPMLPYRGQGCQHAVADARNYVDALFKVWYGGEEREAVMTTYDVEMIERGGEAVKQAAREAELSMSPETVSKMLMVKKGHGRLAQKV